MEMWQASKHGQLFASEETRDQSPTCVTCHMHKGTHNTSIGLSFGNVASGAVLDTDTSPIKTRSISQKAAKEQRALMVETCLPCHSSRFASESLAMADLVKMEADTVVGEAAGVITELQRENLLQWINASPADGKLTDSGEPSEASQPLLGTGQPYDELSPIEQRFFNMVKFHHATTFKGAYHHSPVHTHSKGFLLMKQDLSDIKNKAKQLRSETSNPER
jgi:cytochrome c553